MKVNEIIKERETLLDRSIDLKSDIDKMELQLSDLPFYAEYAEKLKEVGIIDKHIKNKDKEIYDNIIENNLGKVSSDKFIYHIKTSTKPSVKITDESLLPSEAFKKAVVSKTDLGKLMLKYKEDNIEFNGAIMNFNTSLEII